MKIAASIVVTAASLIFFSLAWASPGGREDHSPLVIWGFLGFCALIIIAQLVPAIRNARSATAAKRERAELVAVTTERKENRI